MQHKYVLTQMLIYRSISKVFLVESFPLSWTIFDNIFIILPTDCGIQLFDSATIRALYK